MRIAAANRSSLASRDDVVRQTHPSRSPCINRLAARHQFDRVE